MRAVSFRSGRALLAAASLAACTSDSDSGQILPPKTEVPAQGNPQEDTAISNTLRPELLAFTPELIQRLTVAHGFQVSVFAQDLGDPRMMAVAPDGSVYVTRPKKGDVVLLRDTDGDGRAEAPRVVLSGLENVHGLTLHEGKAYVATPTQVFSAELLADGTWGPHQLFVDRLPDGGQHPNRTLAVGPDRKLYLSVGSSCNACAETNQEHATMLRVNLDGSGREIFARGLRNTIGFGWQPQTGEMWGFDHGSDHRGDDIPPEELNKLLPGKDYGWPYAYGTRQEDPVIDKPKNMTKQQYAAMSEPSVLDYQAHSAPIGMVFYTGTQFPAGYQGDAFVAMRGSWNRRPATGYKLVRVDFEGGQPVGFSDIVSGFLLDGGRAHFGRVAGVTQAADGSLLLGDDTGGVIYRVAYRP
ncbi:PQQ-dependent sugar dehydrogenase [Stigmatella sp. ncwal1]|uniref:PQQ-dependent sugar dehydrogenase n=1 Tax=Stigmatella ashevillensis TaxID=2995309 RepID=A0ABT5DCH3_9BACT|nr:PQQ-dependent sugar dehydrogenase [Stigmatella ashevillena]MDC0710803.1 PQQ-dependent sugar dehydrogenase [Stigmatella ashevillena]